MFIHYFHIYLYSRIICVEDLISPRQFQQKCLFIAQMIHHCGKFIVKVGGRCGSLPPKSLHGLEAFLIEGARDFSWVLTDVLGVPDIYLPASVKSEGCAESTHNICLWVMELSSSVINHLLDFRVQILNKCWLLIILKNTSRHWVLCCSQATQVFGLWTNFIVNIILSCVVF